MPSRIDSPSIPDRYFPTENVVPVVQPVASHHSAASTSFSRTIRSGSQNLQRFFASINCFGSEPLSLDVTTEEGRTNYKLAVRAWAARSASYIQEFQHRKEIAERIDQWLEADDPTMTLDLSNTALKSLPPLPCNLQSLNINNVFDVYSPQKYPKTWPSGLRELDICNNKLKKLPDNLPETLTILDARNY
jgi:hypothetical protein